ncbi:MAG: S-layer homology domain-containing protein [Vulcanimicrobiota bacterium]
MKRIYIKLMLVNLIFLFCCMPALAAPLFPDVQENHWASEAVADLAARGILEGYPDGTFKGDRHLTRWEMAMMIQRAMARLDQEDSKKATKADLEALSALADECRDELNAFGVRITAVEENYAKVDKRTRELEKIRFYGHIQGVIQTMDIYGSLPNAGSRNATVTDWTNGRIMINGVGLSNAAKLGTLVRPTDTTNLGVEFVAYSSYGDDIINNYWGVTPPYLSNPFTAQGTAAPNVQAKNNIPFNKAVMDRFWYNYKPNKTLLTVGSFVYEKTDHLLLRGMRNPNINQPSIIPFYGINLKGNMSDKENCPWSYETGYTRLPNASFYQANLFSGTIQFKKEKNKVGIHGYRVNNRAQIDGIKYAPGTTNAPTLPTYPTAPGNNIVYWRNINGSITNPKLGSQRMYMVGADFQHDFNKVWSAFIRGSLSQYDPDVTNQIYNTTARGYGFNAGVKMKNDKWEGNLQYLYISDKYDPFVLQYGGPGSGIPVFLPFSTYYFNYYQLHDYLKYPSNRQGARADIAYSFSERTRLKLTGDYLIQAKASTLENMTTVGFIEPLFPYLQGGSATKGKIYDWGAHLTHAFNKKFQGGIGYYEYYQKRSTASVLDDIDLKENLAYVNMGYEISRNLTLQAGYTFVRYRGHTGIANTGFRQHIPMVSLNTRLNPSTSVGVTYRYYKYNDMVLPNADWRASNWTLDWKMNF